MLLKKYLKYNNIKLIDPTSSFHADLIKFYNNNGYMTHKQLLALRNHTYSVNDILRLTTSTVTVQEPKRVIKEDAKVPEPIDIDEDEIPF